MDTMTMIAYFINYGVIGWLYETSLEIVKDRQFTNRGFLNTPMLPIYGFGALIVLAYEEYFAFSAVENVYERGLLLLGLILIITVFEYITGFGLEKVFKRTWWDYSHIPLNIKGRISLPISLIWGIIIVIFIEYIHPSLVMSINNIPMEEMIKYVTGFSLILAFDTVFSGQKYLKEAENIELIQKPVEKMKVLFERI